MMEGWIYRKRDGMGKKMGIRRGGKRELEREREKGKIKCNNFKKSKCQKT